MRKFGSVVEFALVVTLSATLTVHTIAAPDEAPEPNAQAQAQAPVPSIEQIEAAVAAADAQAIAINGGRLRPR
jgi:hypothetical protein